MLFVVLILGMLGGRFVAANILVSESSYTDPNCSGC
jgi:hypothetical protein